MAFLVIPVTGHLLSALMKSSPSLFFCFYDAGGAYSVKIDVFRGLPPLCAESEKFEFLVIAD
jgi:hypothetical protein